MVSCITHPEFGHGTGAVEVARAFGEEIRGKTVIISGVSPNGIGSTLALAIATQTPKLLILASRNLANIQAVSNEIRTLHTSTRTEEVVVDLSSLKSVRQAAEKAQEIVGPDGHIDFLFNNAGINVSKKYLTEEGIELQFATNHIGPFLFTNLLLPLMLRTKNGRKRVVNTASEAHVISLVRISDINQELGMKVDKDEQPRKGLPEGFLKNDGSYEPWIAYGQSKTANVLFSVSLNARYSSQGLKSFAVHPGAINTNLARGDEDSTAVCAVPYEPVDALHPED